MPTEHADAVKELVVCTMVQGMKEFVTDVPIVVAGAIRSSWAKEPEGK